MQITIAIPQLGYSPFRAYMKSKYITSLHRAGARVRWIPLKDTQAAVRLAMQCDGLLLPGGADIAPQRYGQIPTEKCGPPNAIRDEAEPLLLDAFLTAGRPVLGICRGVQMLSVVRGGSLLQHIGDGHRNFRGRSKGCHAVRIAQDSQLYRILQCEKPCVNTIHHQAVCTPGEGFIVTAESEDGITEAMELRDYPFCIGVQWHPEHLSPHDASQQRLFDCFVQACKKTDRTGV